MARILWIDDNAGKGTKKRIGFDGLIYFVERNGHTVQIVSSREEIESTLDHWGSFDLLILDIIMDPLSSSSHMDHQYGGIDVLERLGQIHNSTPIIIVSVMQARVIREEANRRGLDLSRIGVRAIQRKGSIKPSEFALVVERLIQDDRHQVRTEEL